MSKASEFVKKYRLSPDEFQMEDQLKEFLEEMRKGLEGEPSSLLMIPTFLQPKENLKRDTPIICADMGGTNLRIAAAQFDEDGSFDPGEIKRYIMPGVEKELTAEEFFFTCACFLAPYCEITQDIVVSFAYRTEVTPEIDGRIVGITKEVKVTDAAGRLLASELKASLKQIGFPDVRIIVINDSVATSLSGRGEHLGEGYGTCTGTILGTGSNSCYVEANRNITKVPGLNPDGNMVINTECGSYNKMPRGAIDEAFDAKTVNPGIGILEKMASGAYLGPLCEMALKLAAQEDIFSTKALTQIPDGALRSADVSMYLANGSGVIEEFLVDEEDERSAHLILQSIVSRAAKLVALQMAACAVKSDRTNDRVLMTIEGSCYDKMHGMRKSIHDYLLPFLEEQQSIEPTIVEPQLAVLKGCAIAGLSHWY